MKSLIRYCLVIIAVYTSTAFSASNDKLVLLTENLPPFNMSIEDKNFSREEGIGRCLGRHRQGNDETRQGQLYDDPSNAVESDL